MNIVYFSAGELRIYNTESPCIDSVIWSITLNSYSERVKIGNYIIYARTNFEERLVQIAINKLTNGWYKW